MVQPLRGPVWPPRRLSPERAIYLLHPLSPNHWPRYVFYHLSGHPDAYRPKGQYTSCIHFSQIIGQGTWSTISLATLTLIARKGNIPPAPAFPKSLAKVCVLQFIIGWVKFIVQTLPSRIHVSEPLKLDLLSLNPTDTSTCKRARAPTPFPGREAAEYVVSS